jgi:PAS domain S-box-containing protein
MLIGMVSHMRLWGALILAIFTLLSTAPSVRSAETFPDIRRILLLHSFEPFLPYSATVNQSIRQTFSEKKGERFEFYSQYLDLARFPDPSHERQLVNLLREKYTKTRPDLVIAFLDPALDFALKYRKAIFGDAPLVFCTIERSHIERMRLPHDVTGVLMELDPAATLEAALQLQPDTKRVVVVGGAHKNDRGFNESVLRAFEKFKGRVAFSYLIDKPVKEIYEEAKKLSPQTIIFYITMFQDGEGKAQVPRDVVARLSSVSSGPVYGLFDSYFGSGIVGGRLVSFEMQGKAAAEMGYRILHGENLGAIAHTPSPNVYLFDWRQLKRWGLSEKHLPPSSIVRFKEYTLWDRYKWWIIGIFAFTILEAFLIIFLLVHRAQRRKAEEALLLTQFSVDHASEAVIRVGPDGTFLYVNDASCRHYGYTRDELLSMRVFDLNPDMGPSVWPKFVAQVKGKKTSSFEARHKRKDGAIVFVEVRGDLVEFRGEEHIVAFMRDITEQKRAQEALISEKERFLTLSDSAPFGLVLVGRDDEITYLNPTFTALLGYNLQDIPNAGEWFSRAYADQAVRARAAEQWKEHKRDGFPAEKGRRSDMVTCKDGTRKLISFIAVPLKTGEIVVTAVDITERSRTEKEILNSRNFLQALLSASPVGILTVRNRTIEWANDVFCRTSGYSLQDLIGRSTRILYESDEEYGRVGKVLYEQGWVEMDVVKKDGTIVRCLLRTAAVDESRWVVTMEDITERKQLESQLMQAQKMEAVGTLAGGVAHDFNNILSVITGFAGLLKMQMPLDDRGKGYVEQILTASEKAVFLTSSLLAFSRKQIIDPKPVSLNLAIEKTRKILSRLIGEDIDMATVLSDEEPVAMVDEGQLDQILINLVTNARDAMPKGGALMIKADITEMDETFIIRHGYGKAGKYATLSISDTGSGMDEKTRQRIFEPFFTTKELGRGTGLGLSIVYGIVKQHNGYIEVVTAPHRGTTFTIYLPLVQSDGKQHQGAKQEGLPGGHETILIGEDEENLRMFLKALLESVGYRVLHACDGEDVVREFMDHKDTIDLVLLDVVMPKMNGWEVYTQLRNTKSGVRVIFSSGYTYDIIHQKGLDQEGIEFVQKPLTPDVLLRKIRAVLDSPKPAFE